MLRNVAQRLVRPSEAAAPFAVAGKRTFIGRLFSAGTDGPIEYELAVPFKAHRIDPPSTKVTTTKAELVQMFTDMYLMRRMEIASDVLYKAKFIRGFCHLYDGQEAVCVGMEAALNFNDSIVTSYRDHCTHLGRGGTVKEVMAELMGRKTGASEGIGGSMHMYRKETNFYGGNGIVGAQAPLGAGLAFAHFYRNEPNVAVAMYGDGAANQGQIYEALNMAALWDLPLIYVIENNHYGMGTAEWRASKNPEFYTRGDLVPGLKINGMCSLSVKQGMAFAKAHCVAGKGPMMIEMDTYRYHGHSMSDPGSTYRTRDEISSVRQERDPVEHIRKLILDFGLMETSEIKAIEKEQRKIVDEAVEFAKGSDLPDLGALHRNIYKDPCGMEMRAAENQYVALPM